MCRPHIISSKISENGNEVSTTADLSASILPENSSALVTSAVIAPQNTRSHFGPSSSALLPRAERVDSTTVPESAEVTKNTKLINTVTAITVLLHG
ncbi:Uncharacterised protein [Pseudomonas fragi]|uniref:Uncharacterized protein n=1 Tax=Pseudomonas fragi TaxID=296 RepID=A0A449IF76_PSEFR|nr:Uncharacterised protein [Pseudomonas fragi]